ncbi:MAG: SdrD B-like domain-containing protein [Pirellulales bacterium]
MGLLRSVRNLARSLNIFHPAHRDPAERTSHLRICGVEALETRRAMAVNPLHLGAVYYEDATGDDKAPDTIQITYQGGAAGTQLTRITIDGDKLGDGLSIGDAFWDIAPGGRGVFGNSPFTITASSGMTIKNVSIADGGTLLVIDIEGWDAGETLTFQLDVDEQGFSSSSAVTEGGEFEGSILTGYFTNPHYEDLTATAIFYDYYDPNFATAAQQAGSTLNLPPDSYMPPDTVDREDRTAGAVVVATQIPKPIELSGVVYHDRDQDVTQDAGEEGLAGVSLTLLQWNGTSYVSTGKTTTTDANGAYKFTGLLPGQYRVVETQPTGYLSTGAKAGTVAGGTRGTTFGADVLTDITLEGGDVSVRNDFGEILPGKISGKVWADPQGDCNFETGGIPLQGVTIELLDAQGNVIKTTLTDADGKYSFDGLVPGSYGVREVQPSTTTTVARTSARPAVTPWPDPTWSPRSCSVRASSASTTTFAKTCPRRSPAACGPIRRATATGKRAAFPCRASSSNCSTPTASSFARR